MAGLRGVYAKKAIVQITRLLSLQDRNPFSPTYGCFDLDYWIHKMTDFPEGVRRFGVHTPALVCKYDFPDRSYEVIPKIG